MKLFLVPLEESWDQLFSALVIVQISHKPKISMERLGLLVVQGIEKVNSVLVGLVREISVQALLHQVAHLHASNIGSVTLQEMNDIVLNGKLLGVLLKQHWQKRVGSTLLIVLRIHVESSFSHVPGGSIGWHDVVAKNSEQIVLQVFQFLLMTALATSFGVVTNTGMDSDRLLDHKTILDKFADVMPGVGIGDFIDFIDKNFSPKSFT